MIRHGTLPDDDRDDHELPKSAPAQRADAPPTGVSRKPRGRRSPMLTAADAVTIKHGHEIVIPPAIKWPEAPDTRPTVREDAANVPSRSTERGHRTICLCRRPNGPGGLMLAARRRPAAYYSATYEEVLGERGYFRRVIDELRINLPPKHPVVVQTTRQFVSRDGDCCLADGTFRIRISRELCLSRAIDVLLHEWAHALSWHACFSGVGRSRRLSNYEFDRLSHGPKWGISYSKVYQCFTYDIEPQVQADLLHAARLGTRRARRKGGTK